MDERVRALAHELLESGVERLSERERKIIARIAHRHHVSRNVSADFDDGRGAGERWADRLAIWGGSWPFVFAFLGFWARGSPSTSRCSRQACVSILIPSFSSI
jgi:hypothetical protein